MPRVPQQQRAKATVDAIVEAGFISVHRHGLAGTTTTHIADIAGISVGSLYEYFANKEAIYLAMHERFVTDLVATLQTHMPEIVRMGIVDAVQALLRHIQALLLQDDERYLKYGRSALSIDLKVAIEPVTRVLSEFIMQYLMHNPEYARIPRFAAMSYIFVNGGIFTVTRHLSDPNPPISFDELVDGLAHMVNHYVLMELQMLAAASAPPHSPESPA